MTIVAEYDVETNTMTNHDARTAYREAVAQVAARARAKLPACAGRIDSAVKLVLLGEVTLLPDGTATVGSCTDPTKTYAVNGTCTCQDFERAPGQLCKHRLAYGIARRASELVPPPSPALPAPSVEPPVLPAAPALPEARCSMNVHLTIAGRQVQVTLRGHEEIEVLARLERLLARYPQPQAPAPAQASSQSQDATPTCPEHGAMKRSTKGKGWYCPNKLADDSWCPSKGK